MTIIRRMIVVAAALAAVACTLTATQAAQAHESVWFTSAAKMARMIDDHYNVADQTICKPVPASLRERYQVERWFRPRVNEVWWNHFVCGVYSYRTDRVCIAIAHVGGAGDGDFWLTSFPARGCTPNDLRRAT